MRIALLPVLAHAGCLALSAPLLAQSPSSSPAAPKNMIGNPGFESGFRNDNLWDGVDNSGYLAGQRGELPILTSSGTISPMGMPISVSVADLNGDGLPDIAAMDVLGYLRVYFNSGTKTEPKFTIGELAGLFLSRINPDDPTLQGVNVEHARQGQRIHLSDITRSGKKDLLIGNYLGEIMLIPNAGSGSRPEFRQPSNLASAIIPTMKDSLKKWGNLFAPATWDWNHDGKDDLLLGEGSYSANSIHLLLNQGAGSKPVFDENNRSVLAYGMGLEQLTPCVVDYNGDGKMDLLVAERTGKVAVYLGAEAAWKPGDKLAFDSFIPVGGASALKTSSGNGSTSSARDPLTAATAPGLLSLGAISTVAAADLNGDGLFDLVFGKSSGRIAISLNSGSKTQPKFAAPIELKGDAGTPPFNSPSGWDCDYGLSRGNFFGFISVVKGADDADAKPPEGNACLRAGYSPCTNKFLPAPTTYSPAFAKWKPADDKNPPTAKGAPANYFQIRQEGNSPLATKQTYIFSMRVKGSKVTDASVSIQFKGSKKLSEDRIERGDRGSATIKTNVAREEKNEFIAFSPGSNWSEVRKEVNVKFDSRDLQDLDKVEGWSTTIAFTLAPGSGSLFIDDIKLLPK